MVVVTERQVYRLDFGAGSVCVRVCAMCSVRMSVCVCVCVCVCVRAQAGEAKDRYLPRV